MRNAVPAEPFPEIGLENFLLLVGSFVPIVSSTKRRQEEGV